MNESQERSTPLATCEKETKEPKAGPMSSPAADNEARQWDVAFVEQKVAELQRTQQQESVDGVLGTTHMGPNHPGRGSHVATASFMIVREARGRGIGRLLGEHALSWARGRGYAAMQFNAVVETNYAAVRLWRALGFEVIGTVPEAFEHPALGRVGLHVMHRYL